MNGVTESGVELIERSLLSPPELIIAAPRLADMDGIETMIRISEDKPTAEIIIARSDDLEKGE
jgi:response regulator NasT